MISWYLCYIYHLLELRFICIKISLNMILGISKLNWVIWKFWNNDEMTWWLYIDSFQMFRTRFCMYSKALHAQTTKMARVLFTVEHFFFMLIKLKCTGYRVIIYNCLGTGAALSYFMWNCHCFHYSFSSN